MIATLNAIKAALAPLDYPTHLFYAANSDDPIDSNEVPYLVLDVGTRGEPEEMPICSESEILEFDLRVIAVSAVEDGPPKILALVSQVLSPAYGVTRINAGGRLIDVRYMRSDVTSSIDRDHVMAKTNRNPAFGVDTFHIVNQPAQERRTA